MLTSLIVTVSTSPGNSISNTGFLYKAYSTLAVFRTTLISTFSFFTTVDKFLFSSDTLISALLTGSTKEIVEFTSKFYIHKLTFILHNMLFCIVPLSRIPMDIWD